jgi:pyridinium-3,5-biscarboxylic acid mononucleotide sulfurtransferase
MQMDCAHADSKYAALQSALKNMKSVLVAFSGGVDSTLLLKVARDTLEDGVLAVTATSATTAAQEKEDAVRLASLLSVPHLVVESHELDLSEFTENPPDKCYVCKKHRFGELIRLARENGFNQVVDGENADDKDDYRPGSRATRELGVRSPLKEAGLSKQEIRALSKRLDLPTWNKPSYACLASRIPYRSPITREKLAQVDAAEECIHEMAHDVQVRVRHYGDTARIEVQSEAIPILMEQKNRERIVTRFKELGFVFVTLDLEGYRMGSLNRVIGKEANSPSNE